MAEAELVLRNGKIWTGERDGNATSTLWAEAVAIANGRFVAVGSNQQVQAYLGANTRIIDLTGRMAMPGFIDSHVHFIFGSLRISQVYLKDARDEAEFTARIAHKARALAPGQWILGGTWDETNWPSRSLPTRWMIDPVTPETPVCVERYDGHEVLANSLALKLAGITRHTPDPAGGIIVRDSAGEPTGVLKDTATAAVERNIPHPSWDELEATFKTGLAEARRLGVTSVHDMFLGRFWSPNDSLSDWIELLRRAASEGWLTCRFSCFTPIEQWPQLAQFHEIHAQPSDLAMPPESVRPAASASASDFLRLGAVKGFADGSTGSRTSWFHQDYSDQPGYFGVPRHSCSEMEALVKAADAAGLQIAIHAIGDRANTEVLDAYRTVAGPQAASRRFRIEHAQHLRPQDFASFAELGVIASMQPYHAVDDARWLEHRIGRERCRTSFAWRSMLDAGVPLAFGTDWPIAPLNPLLSLWAAVNRQPLHGRDSEPWFPEQRVTLDEALRAYTQGGAYAECQEKIKGTIAPGKLADMVALSSDLFGIPPQQIKDERVIATIVAGRVVYEE